METKKPVALWKGIVGASVSAFVLLLTALITIVVYSANKSMEMWLILFLIIAGIICLLSFAISLANISEAVAYRRQNRTIKVISTNETSEKHNVDYIEEIKMLKELLDSGAITQEEFDAKKKQLLK